MTTPTTPASPTLVLRRSALAAAAAVLIAAGPAAGQETFKPGRADQPRREPAPKTRQEEGRRVFEGKPKSAGGAQAQPGSWSVVIATFRGDGAEREAQDGLRRVRTLGGLPDAVLETRGEATVIAYGSFAGPNDPGAQAALEKVRRLEVELPDGRRGTPFSEAILAPPAGFAGSTPEYDLAQARRLKGDWAIYTLQVARYGPVRGTPKPDELATARAAAEEAVVTLRRQGEQAYYYHGPTGSTVTIGLFGADDFVPGEGASPPQHESVSIRELRKRFPHNLVNGAGVRETVRAQGADGQIRREQRMQASRLVAVPR